MENKRATATSSNIPSEEGKDGTTGPAGRGLIYHIYGKVVTKEEWTQFHQNITDQWRNEENNEEKNEEKNKERDEGTNEEEKTEEGMSNKHESDKEEAMGENYHHENHSLPEGTVATLQFLIQKPEGIVPMKNISPSVLPRFHGKAVEDPDKIL